jgi:hypothetical protein
MKILKWNDLDFTRDNRELFLAEYIVKFGNIKYKLHLSVRRIYDDVYYEASLINIKTARTLIVFDQREEFVELFNNMNFELCSVEKH